MLDGGRLASYAPASKASFNTDIPRREYLGVPHSYLLPSVTDLGTRLIKQGWGHTSGVPMSPGPTTSSGLTPLAQPLFSSLVDGRRYIDVTLPFGCRTSGAT